MCYIYKSQPDGIEVIFCFVLRQISALLTSFNLFYDFSFFWVPIAGIFVVFFYHILLYYKEYYIVSLDFMCVSIILFLYVHTYKNSPRSQGPQTLVTIE